MVQTDLKQTFDELAKLLNRHAKGLAKYDACIGSQAKGSKPGLQLYGMKEVGIAVRKPQQTYVAGIIQQKSYVGFYHMPVYSHPGEFELNAKMKKAKSGKSCFQIKTDAPVLLAEAEKLLVDGIRLYKGEGWI